MKKFLFSISLPFLLLASNADLEQRIESLEKTLHTMQETLKLNNEDKEEFQSILEKVETKSILDKVNFAPELILRADEFDYTTGQIAGENTKIYDPTSPYDGMQRRDEYTKHFDVANSIKFRLNMSAKLDNNLEFYGTMIFMHSTQSNQRICILSRDVKSADSLSAFDVERAYFNYTTDKYSKNAFTFSFGLLPTTDGTPMQFSKNAKRKSMFPSLVFDMNTYGVIATQKYNDNTFLRAILARAYTLRPNFYPYQCNRENIDNANVIGLYADTKFYFLGNSLLSFGINILNDFKAHPYLGPDVSSSDSHNLGDMYTYGIGLDIQNFLESDTIFFAHTAFSNPHPNGEVDDYQIVAIDGVQTLQDGLTSSGSVGFTEASYATGEMIGNNGYSLYLGLKYKISKKFNVGAEYNYGSKYWFSATQGAEDMYNKLATRGYVGEGYINWTFHKNLYLKLGHMHIQENYTGSGWHFGEPAHKDALQKITYLALVAKF